MKLPFQAALQEIKNRIDILTGISKYLAIKKSGNSFVAVCPFHADKSPSLHISPSKGIYKCFACGASGDLFRFLMEYKKMAFSEVVQDLAEECGLEIIKKEISVELNEEQNWIFKLNGLATNFFIDHLKGQAKDYLLNQRKLSTEIIQNFALGFAANSRDSLLNFTKEALNPPEEILNKSGLFIVDSYSGALIDRFRNRLIIPIKDAQSRIVAFGGRTLDNNTQPKYLNSPETSIYTKGQHLFGWNIAQSFTKAQKQILLLEGYFDVIQAHANGLNYAVGSLGTALTKEQASILYTSNLARCIVLGFDNDNAGERALIASIKVFQESRFSHKPDLRALKLNSDYKDIDEYLLKNSASQAEELIKSAPKVYEFIINLKTTNLNLQDPNARSEALKELAELLKGENDLIEKELWAEACARALNFSKNTVLSLFENNSQALPSQNKQQFQKEYTNQNRKFTAKTKPKPSNNAEKTLVSLLFWSLSEEALAQIRQANLSNSASKELKDKLIKMSEAERKSFIQDNSEEILSIALWNEGKDLSLILEECLQEIEKAKKFQSTKKLMAKKRS